MAVAFNNPSNREIGAVNSITLSHTCTGNERLLLIGIGIFETTTRPTVTACEYPSGTPCLKKWDFAAPDATSSHELWYLPNPSPGANLISVTFSGTITEGVMGGASFTGVDQTTPLGTEQTASGSSTTATVSNIASASDELVVDFLFAIWAAATQETAQTSRWQQDHSGGFVTGGMSTKGGAALVSMSWNEQTSSGFTEWGIGGVSIKPSAAVTFPKGSLALLDVGI